MTSTKKSKKSPAIGIDLGTWKCCVGVVREGKVEIIENERGSKTTPSYVAFTETERLVGEDAKDQVALNPTNTVSRIKRIIGRRFDDPSIQNDMKLWPFTIFPDEVNRPRIRVQYRGSEKDLSPEQVSAMMLEKMKRIAQSHLRCEVKNAVISVSASFNNAQRQATKDAAAIAGLNVLGLINEPTAAALAYRDNKTRVEPHNVLIFDLGGGTFDVAVIRVEEGGVKVMGVCGDTEFGGNEMDVLLMKHFEEKFCEKYGKPGLQDNKGLERLRTASEKIKKTLTLLPKANAQVDSLMEGIDFNATIKRHYFEQLCDKDMKERMEAVLTNVLRQASIQSSDVNEVVLVGGTTRIPKVRSILQEFFSNKALNKTINPDEAVAHGAALQAAVLAGDNEFKEVFVADMFQVPPSTEMKRMDGKFRNYRAIPKCSFSITTNYCEEVFTKYPGEFDEAFSHIKKASNLHKLNSFGIFDIYLKVEGSWKETKEILPGCLAVHEIPQLIAKVEQFTQDDLELKEGVVAMSDLEAFCFQTKALVASNGRLREKLGLDNVMEIIGHCENMICWLDDNDSRTNSEYQSKKRELCSQITLVLERTSVWVGCFCGLPKEWLRDI